MHSVPPSSLQASGDFVIEPIPSSLPSAKAFSIEPLKVNCPSPFQSLLMGLSPLQSSVEAGGTREVKLTFHPPRDGAAHTVEASTTVRTCAARAAAISPSLPAALSEGRQCRAVSAAAEGNSVPVNTARMTLSHSHSCVPSIREY